jgi:hypothetical protein
LDFRVNELTQAKLFTDTMALAGDYGDLPPVLDLEMNPSPYALKLSPEDYEFGMNLEYKKNPNLSSVSMENLMLTNENYTLTKPQVQGKVWNFLQAVEKTTGKIPVIYCGYYYWIQWMTSDPAWARYPFWLAWYNSENVIKVPPPWFKWTFWQYSGNGNGPQYGSEGLSLDMDYYNGTLEDLKKFSGISTPIPVPVPTPTPIPVINQYVTIYRVNVREKNDPNSTKLGTIPINTTLVVNNYVANQYSYFQPINDFPNGGYVYSVYIKKKEV